MMPNLAASIVFYSVQFLFLSNMIHEHLYYVVNKINLDRFSRDQINHLISIVSRFLLASKIFAKSLKTPKS